MRIGNLDGRLVLLDDGHAVDVEQASAGRFGSDPQAVFDRWDEFVDWAADHDGANRAPLQSDRLGPPVPRPPQVFGIGLNYRDHAEEAGLALPEEPMVFTKFPSSITGPHAEVRLPSDRIDHEVELVAVIGKAGFEIPAEDAWDHVAGLTVGQDLSDRAVQFRDQPPQFSLGKSFPGFSPIGPVLVTPDEFVNPNRLAIGCAIDDKTVQDGSTADMVFPVAELIARLSAVVRLLPGDLIFTGTPAGVGAVQDPPRYICPGDVLISSIEGIGQMRTTFVPRH
jgi:2,4-didehydro-3-deoxy-L-rhamnonate hydrolase